MNDPIPSSDPVEDPLALFGPETVSPPPKRGPASIVVPVPLKPVAEKTSPLLARPLVPAPSADVTYPTASVLNRVTAPAPEPVALSDDMANEIVSPPPPAGTVSFAQISTVKGLGFVDGVAMIQATCETLSAAGSTGVPDLDGLFLTDDGNVLVQGPPSGEPAAKQLARLLHQLVAPELMPPAGRLFVGRWIDNEASGLAEFSLELAYFARPNGQELLVSVYRRCEGAPVTTLRPVERPRQEPPKDYRRAKDETVETPNPPSGVMAWARAHKPAITAGIALVAAAATFTAIGTLLWAPGTVEASKEAAEIDAATADSAAPGGLSDAGDIALRGSARKPANRATRSGVPASRRNPPPVLDSRDGLAGVNQSPVPAIESRDVAREQAADAAAPLTSRPPPDLRIYSTNDSGVEPPRLRSAEIPELLIAGFERRQNRIELVISERGEVQHARMVGEPQRMPDIMLLSRAKELQFDPATRNGVPVRYRLILSWNVTP